MKNDYSRILIMSNVVSWLISIIVCVFVVSEFQLISKSLFLSILIVVLVILSFYLSIYLTYNLIQWIRKVK